MTTLLAVAALLALALAAGFLYQWLGYRSDRRRFARGGEWFSIGEGRELYLLRKGAHGPTVVFEAGIAATNLNWAHIQDSVAEFASAVAYDRSGLGWSSPARTPRTPSAIAGELHQLLAAAGLEPPYILVGHSFGGLVLRRFALLYPGEVESLLLIDPMRCEEWPPLDPERQQLVDRGARLSGYAIPIAHFGLARLAVTSLLCRSGRTAERLAGAAGQGGLHILNRIRGEVGKMPRHVWPIVAAHWSRPGYYAGMRSHIRSVPDTVREMHQAPPIPAIPILLLTPSASTPLSAECLGAIGDNVRQQIAPDSRHWIHLDRPELVVESIRELCRQAREPAVSSLSSGLLSL